MDRPTFDGDIVVADGLPLQRLYARFDAIARGPAFGIGSAAHQSVIARLAFNQKRAESVRCPRAVHPFIGYEPRSRGP